MLVMELKKQENEVRREELESEQSCNEQNEIPE